MSIQLILYDLDGTLANTKEDLAVAVNRTLAELGLATRSHAELYGFVGNGVRMLLSRAVGGETDGNALTHALNVFRGHYLAHLTDHSRLYPGVDTVLDRYAHLHQAIVTNKPLLYARGVVQNLGLKRRTDLLIAGDSTPHLKPHPAMLQAALDHFGMAPEQALMVGDGLPDIGAARALGIPCVALTCGMGIAAELAAAKPDFLLDRIDAIDTVITPLSGVQPA